MPTKIVDLSARSEVIRQEPISARFGECTPLEFKAFLGGPRKFLETWGSPCWRTAASIPPSRTMSASSRMHRTLMAGATRSSAIWGAVPSGRTSNTSPATPVTRREPAGSTRCCCALWGGGGASAARPHGPLPVRGSLGREPWLARARTMTAKPSALRRASPPMAQPAHRLGDGARRDPPVLHPHPRRGEGGGVADDGLCRRLALVQA